MNDWPTGVDVGTLVTLFGIAVAAAVAIYQITKQARMGLKLDLYRQVLATAEKHSDAQRELDTKLHILRATINDATRGGGEGLTDLDMSWHTLTNMHHQAQFEGAGLLCLIEDWHIVDNRLSVFTLAFNSAFYDLRQAWTKLFPVVGDIIPPGEGFPAPARPGNDLLNAASCRLDEYLSASSKLEAWVADFKLEMQRLLLSDLFRNKLPHRKPIDPRIFVVSLERHRSIKTFFENETAWGREMAQIKAWNTKAHADTPKPKL